jgi:hypothetical protein
MSAALRRRVLYGALVLLFIFRFDFWNWHRSDVVFGLPVSLLYHLLVCVSASILLFFLTRYAWPIHTESREDEADR